MTSGLFSAIMALGPEPQKIVRQDLDSILDFTDLVGRITLLDFAAWVDGPCGLHYPDRPKINRRTEKLLWQDADGLGSLVLELFKAVTSVQYELRHKRVHQGLIESLAASWKVTTALESLISDIDRSTAAVQLPESSPSTGIPLEKRTRPMSKTEAIKFIGWPAHAENARQAVDWLTQSIRDGEYRWEKQSHKKGVYHIDDFPAECHREIRRT